MKPGEIPEISAPRRFFAGRRSVFPAPGIGIQSADVRLHGSRIFGLWGDRCGKGAQKNGCHAAGTGARGAAPGQPRPPGGPRCGAGGQPERRQEHGVQRVNRVASAYGELGREDGLERAGLLHVPRARLCARRPAGLLLADGPLRRGGSGAGFPVLRRRGRCGRRVRCDVPRAQPEPRFADDRAAAAHGRLRQPDGRGEAPRRRRRPRRAAPAVRRAGRRGERAQPARAGPPDGVARAGD